MRSKRQAGKKFTSLKVKHFRLLAICLVALITVLFIFSLLFTGELTKENVLRNQSRYVKELDGILRQDMEKIAGFAASIALDRNMTQILAEQRLNEIDPRKYEMIRQIRRQAIGILSNFPYIASLTISDLSGDSLSVSFSQQNKRKDISYLLNERIRQEAWFLDIREGVELSDNWWGVQDVSIFNNPLDNGKYLTCVHPVTDMSRFPNYRVVGFIYVVVDGDYFGERLASFLDDNVGRISLLDQSGFLIASSERLTSTDTAYLSDMTAQSNTEIYQRRGVFQYDVTAMSKSDRYKWTLIMEIPVGFQIESIAGIIWLLLGLILSFIVIFFIFFYREERLLIRPIYHLHETIGQIGTAGVKSHTPVFGNDEIAMLSQSFNEMMDRLDESEKERTKQELAVLQAQIKPHFLYNTLNTLQMMAIQHHQNEIRFAVGNLIKLFKSSIGDTDTEIPLEKEFDLLISYVSLQRLRFGNVFQTTFDLPDILKDCLVPRMVLQPILENAILYGTDGNRICNIRVAAQLEGDSLLLVVEDDGTGMSEEKIKAIHIKPKDEVGQVSSIGIYNTNIRLQLLYGVDSGVSIQSREQEGTRVQLHIPVRRKEESPE